MAIIDARRSGPNEVVQSMQNLLSFFLQRERLEQAKEAQALKEKEFKLTKDQFELQLAQAQQPFTQLVQGLGGGDPAAQQTLAQSPAAQRAIQAAGNATQEFTNPAVAAGQEVAAIQEQQAADEQMRQILAAFKPEEREGVRTVLGLRAAGVTGDNLQELGSRVLPESAMQRLDRRIKEQELATAQQRHVDLRADAEMQRFFAQDVLGLPIERLPESAITALLRATNPEKFSSPDEVGFSLLKSLLTQVVVDPNTGIAKTVFTPEQAAVRAERGLQFLFEGQTLNLTNEDRAEALFLSAAMDAITSNAQLNRRDRRSTAEVRNELVEAAVAQAEANGLDVSAEEWRRLFAEALKQAGILGVTFD